ncbi:MAG TPA: hypothetical protein VHV57_19390 [Acidimicrobiales bacterium]|jgi:hypothetical protein|nr:hypothetical protein [Acidimicrobiales bacterium]
MSIGPLVGADELFAHQIVDTFGSVAESDRSWTEKAWAQACANDGSLQLAFGIGKYPNRDVLDATAGVSRGVEQWAVRASRRLSKDRESLSVGPITYEVNQALRQVTFSLEPNDVQPISFQWRFDGVVPPFLENREIHRSRDGSRREADLIRFHQSGQASGWVDVDGERTEIGPQQWTSTRDRSWGVRYQVGGPPPDVAPTPAMGGVSVLMMWSPIVCTRADGSHYALHWYYQRHAAGSYQRVELQGGVEHADGHKEHFAALVPELTFRDDNRRFQSGRLRFVMADGSERPLDVTAVSDTGFHLGSALYFGLDDQWHGQWRGSLHVEGDYMANCADPVAARRLHQLRSTVVRVDDPIGGGVGFGDFQTLAVGADEAMGLTEAASFM